MPPAQPEYRLPALPEPAAPSHAAAGGQMYVNRIEVRGVTALKPALIAAMVAPYEKRVVTGAELQTLRVELTRLYIDKGYLNSGVLLPDQESKDGLVVFQAVEGKLTRVQVEHGTKLSEHYIEPRIRDRVSDPVSVTAVQGALRYLQQDANVARLDARFGPGDALGEGVLYLAVQDQPRFTVGVGADNYQSSSIGADEGKVFFSARDLTGYGDELKASVGRSSGNTVGSGVLSVPVSAHDALFQAYYSRGDAAIIQQPFKELNIKETIRTYGLSLTVPLIDGIHNRFSLFAGGESSRSFTELLGTGFSFSPGAQNGVTSVAVALGGADWLIRGSNSVTDLRLTYRRGLHALGATINSPADDQLFNPNPTGADGRFGLEQLQFVHIERLNGFSFLSQLNDRAQIVLHASGQIAQDPLLSLVKFAVGGVDTVRGVPANLFVRDNGAAATVELQLPLPGYRTQPSVRDLVVAPFIDYGRSWDKVNAAPGNPAGDTSTPRYVASAGLGLLWNPATWVDTQIYWGRPIANNFGDDDPRRFVPHDVQYHGFYYALNLTAHW